MESNSIEIQYSRKHFFILSLGQLCLYTLPLLCCLVSVFSLGLYVALYCEPFSSIFRFCRRVEDTGDGLLFHSSLSFVTIKYHVLYSDMGARYINDDRQKVAISDKVKKSSFAFKHLSPDELLWIVERLYDHGIKITTLSEK